mmetsp:Transcript_17080/g.19679  ORF Transcript_17080/g.19679 Transcript_17080/m.19679 type:complete len:108 (-) Transcript_17080:224-547(-)|eukprot:CAMPEP_0194145338 /NCGR_PEP_ID=MMETSP0152-20130528/16919_1 /TAXON_ID=1049557 /ORGANISM="Thalassiothrix antarctica, Strain L6-D1" /LENGTH=107 /DNA_ID=CAMNT_0038845533 /DNA_START=101 /DNA_END=424 /DNA_ORIENTATION=+
MEDVTTEKARIEAWLKNEADQSKKIWEMRGREARIKAIEYRAANHNTWRQMSGLRLMMHEVAHPGNYPFVMGLAIVTGFAVYTAKNFTDKDRLTSPYWQQFHAEKKP